MRLIFRTPMATIHENFCSPGPLHEKILGAPLLTRLPASLARHPRCATHRPVSPVPTAPTHAPATARHPRYDSRRLTVTVATSCGFDSGNCVGTQVLRRARSGHVLIPDSRTGPGLPDSRVGPGLSDSRADPGPPERSGELSVSTGTERERCC